MTRRKITMDDLQLWYCEGCGAVHLSAGGLQLDFTSKQFEQFARAVADVHSAAWFGDIKLNRLDRRSKEPL